MLRNRPAESTSSSTATRPAASARHQHLGADYHALLGALTRSGNTFTAEISADGTSWTTLGTQTITMGTERLHRPGEHGAQQRPSQLGHVHQRQPHRHGSEPRTVADDHDRLAQRRSRRPAKPPPASCSRGRPGPARATPATASNARPTASTSPRSGPAPPPARARSRTPVRDCPTISGISTASAAGTPTARPSRPISRR